MTRALIWLGFVAVSLGCGRAAPPAVLAPSVVAVAPRPAPPAPAPSTCRAEPETVYGQEPVVFHVQAAAPTIVEVRLVDATGAALRLATVPAPGDFQPADVPSGDFTLQLGPDLRACSVTVNRELPRASQATR